MVPVITIKGIEEAISNLNYRNANTLKQRLVALLREFYRDEQSIKSLRGIDRDELIKSLWDTGDDQRSIKNRRKNLSSLKSSVNRDLDRLYKGEKNPEGIRIGPDYILIMSDEAKDKILQKLKESMAGDSETTLDQIADLLKMIKETLTGPESLEDENEADDQGIFEKIKGLIKSLSETVNDVASGRTGDLEEIDEDEIEELIEDEVEESDLEEIEEEPAEDVLEDDVEEIDEDEIEELIEDEVEESDLEEIEEEPAEDVLEDDVEDVDEDEIEELIEDDVEEGDQGPFSGIEGLGTGLSDEEYDIPEDIRKARLLAEQFDGYLGAMDRYFNQYLLIPEGVYRVGGGHPEGNEKTERKVHLPPFYFGKYPVTNALFEIFIEKTGYITTAERLGSGTVYFPRYQERINEKTGRATISWNSSLECREVEGACWYQPFGPESTLHHKRNHPIVQVSLEDAMAFAAWIGKRLPTEEEWEAASRSEKGFRFPWGDEWKERACNNEESYAGDTTPVDKYEDFENAFGIVDTLGNTWEWIQNIQGAEGHSQGGKSSFSIVKGGGWTSRNGHNLMSRDQLDPKTRSNILGFRCVAF